MLRSTFFVMMLLLSMGYGSLCPILKQKNNYTRGNMQSYHSWRNSKLASHLRKFFTQSQNQKLVILSHPDPKDKTISGEYYKNILKKKNWNCRKANWICEKKKFNLNQDNVNAHDLCCRISPWSWYCNATCRVDLLCWLSPLYSRLSFTSVLWQLDVIPAAVWHLMAFSGSSITL